jgi:hypothetical protein
MASRVIMYLIHQTLAFSQEENGARQQRNNPNYAKLQASALKR